MLNRDFYLFRLETCIFNLLNSKFRGFKHAQVRLSFLQFQADPARPENPWLLVFLEALLPQALLVDLLRLLAPVHLSSLPEIKHKY